MTQLEKDMNAIVPKMLKRFGKTARIGYSLPNGTGSAGGTFRIFMTFRGYSDFWLGGGGTPVDAWKDALTRWPKGCPSKRVPQAVSA